jgi:hypothetical protein
LLASCCTRHDYLSRPRWGWTRPQAFCPDQTISWICGSWWTTCHKNKLTNLCQQEQLVWRIQKRLSKKLSWRSAAFKCFTYETYLRPTWREVFSNANARCASSFAPQPAASFLTRSRRRWSANSSLWCPSHLRHHLQWKSRCGVWILCSFCRESWCLRQVLDVSRRSGQVFASVHVLENMLSFTQPKFEVLQEKKCNNRSINIILLIVCYRVTNRYYISNSRLHGYP